MEINENELLYLYIQGSEEAFNELYSIFKIYFLKILTKHYKNLIEQLGTDDLLQEGMLVFVRVMWEYRDDHATTFRTYVRSCVEKKWKTMYRQACNNKHRAQLRTLSMDCYYDRQGEKTKNLYDYLVEERVDYCPRKRMYVTEKMDWMQDYLKNHLNDQERQIAYMKIRGYSTEEIARKLVLSPKQVSNLIYRMKKK